MRKKDQILAYVHAQKTKNAVKLHQIGRKIYPCFCKTDF